MTPSRPKGLQPWRDFPPHALRDYAFIADGHRGALVGPRGDIAWLCAPSWDSEAVLSALIGGLGVYAVAPAIPSVWGGYYEDRSLVWHSRWATTLSLLECHEALARPADQHRLVLLRRLHAVDGDTPVQIRLDLRARFGRHRLSRPRRDNDGVWTARTGSLRVRWQGGTAARYDEQAGLLVDLVLAAGEYHDFVLEVSDAPLDERPDAERAWADTRATWERAVPSFPSVADPRATELSYAVVEGLTSPGGMIAAPTLGLPERADRGRNYDYRYVWLRDQAYAGLAMAVDEPLPLLGRLVGVTVERVLEHGPGLAPAYRVDGRSLPPQHDLGLPGYPGGAAVDGNWVRGQFQLDSIGDVIQLLTRAAELDHLDDDGRKALALMVETAESRWQEKEAGIWELDDERWTQSRLAVVAGLRAASRVSAGAGRLASLADVILTETGKRCLRPDGSWARSPEHSGTDSSLLLPLVRGALPTGDPRISATLAAVYDELVEGGYCYRFRHSPRPLGDQEGAFLLCGFAVSLAHLADGNLTEAVRWFERHAASSGSPGLFSEEFDVRQGQLRGNLPQGFVHALMLETAQRLGAALA